MLPEDDRMIETCRSVLSVLMQNFRLLKTVYVGRVPQSVKRLTTGWTVRDRIPVGTRFSARPD